MAVVKIFMCSQLKNKILVIGQLPPPYHGSNVMTGVTLSALKTTNYRVYFIDKSFAKSIETIGKPSLKKMLRVPFLAIEILIACLIKRPTICIYFIAAGTSAFFVDAALLFLLRLCCTPYILRFGGKGYRELQNKNSFWHLLVSFTLSNALGGIVLGNAIKKDVNLFIPNERLIYVPNGIENGSFFSQKASKDYIQILFLANLHPQKGPLRCFKNCKYTRQTKQKFAFCFSGGQYVAEFYGKAKIIYKR